MSMPVPTMAFAMPPPFRRRAWHLNEEVDIESGDPLDQCVREDEDKGRDGKRTHATENSTMALFFALRQKRYSFSLVVIMS